MVSDVQAGKKKTTQPPQKVIAGDKGTLPSQRGYQMTQ